MIRRLIILLLIVGCNNSTAPTPTHGCLDGQATNYDATASIDNNTCTYIDSCGVIDIDITNDCIQDCAGIWGGSKVEDNCGICGGECFGDISQECGDFDCDGNCVAEVDCQGICGGNNVPTFQCENGNVVCNPADCNLDIPLYLLPDEFGINKIFPNPFNPVTQIQYEIALYGLVSIRLFDIRGREVDQLIHEYQSPGHYNITWNAGNNASGMYIVELVIQSGNAAILRDFKKILYLK